MYGLFAKLYLMSNKMITQFQNLPTVLNSIFNPGGLSRIQLAAKLLQGVSEEQAKVNAAFAEGAQRVRAWIGMVKSVGQAVLVPAAQEADLKHRYMAATGDNAQGETLYHQYREEAFKKGQNVQDTLKGALAFLPQAQNVEQVEKLKDMAQRLKMLSPDSTNMTDASNAIAAAMKGDNTALSTSFNIPKELLDGSGLQANINASDLDGFIQKLDVILEKQGYTQQAFETMLDSPMQKWNALMNQFNGVLGQLGQSALIALTPLLDRLNEAFANGEFTVMIDGITNAIAIAANVLVMLVDGILYLAAIIQQNWEIIQPILMALAIVVLAIVIAQVYSLVAAWLLLNWPILLAIAAIALIIMVLNAMGVSGTQILSAIIGTFLMLVEVVRYVVATVWNRFATLAEFLINLFIDPAYAFKKLFYDMGIFAIDTFGSVVSFIEKAIGTINAGINSLTSFLNNTFGWELNMLPEDVDLGGSTVKKWKGIFEDNFTPHSDKDVVEIPRMDGLFNKDADKNADQIAKDLLSSFQFTSPDSDKTSLPGGFGPQTPAMPAVPLAPTAPSVPTMQMPNNTNNINKINNVGKVDQIGDVSGTVDVTSEDLKLMRELAEMQAIQRFVSLTPTVQVTTGDINSGHDIDSIITKITDGLNSQIVSNAQGVYG